MAIRAELSADKDRGPGFGLLRIAGLGTAGGTVDLSLKCNQVTAPFLGTGGRWQATETWHSVTAMTAEGDDLLIPVGPEIVDAIVAQPSRVAYYLTVATGVQKQGATLTVHRLLGSGAAADDQAERERLQREAEERERQEREAERLRQEEAERARLDEAERLRREQEEATVLAAQRQAAEPIAPVFEPEPQRRRWMLALIPAVLVLSVAAVAGSWYACLIPIPGLVPARCTAESAAETAQPSAEAPAAVASPSSCAGLGADECIRLAETALSEKRLEPARQLFQQAVQLGGAQAAVALGRMYDPETWSAAASPAPAADWETAVYWYETAARAGDGAGLLGAGRLLCREAKSDIERRQGLKYLREAETKGVAEAKALIPACEAKGS
ncbi:hypothetical protein DF3PA_120028 [Candidatus Defluviicoccus seviourii]|uniref:Sel1 repeat family protein n=2 Tax=root TaxID=1 RepID=A0A564WAE4_9PROT|nr:hypothetical protein DF3PA_120028 [Candidatus Defluviicoccus seviourii]